MYKGRDIVVFISELEINQGYLELLLTTEATGISKEDLAFINPSKFVIAGTNMYFTEGVFYFDTTIGEFGGYKIPIK